MTQKHRIYRCISSAITVLLFSTLIILATTSLANADELQTKEWLTEATATIKKQEKNLKDDSPVKYNIDALSNDLKDINKIKSGSQVCITTTENQLIKVTEDLATLGEPTAKESAEVVKKRRSLTAQLKDLDQKLSSCKLLQLQSQDLISSINELQQSIIGQQLFARTPGIITVLAENINTPSRIWNDTIEFFRSQYQHALLSAQQFILILLLVLISTLTGIFLKRRFRAMMPAEVQPKDSASAFGLSIRTSLVHALPILLPVTASAIYLSIVQPFSPLAFSTKISYLLGIYFGLITLINILLSPVPPAIYLAKPEKLSLTFSRHLKVTTALIVIGFFLFTGEFKASLSEPVYYLNRGIYSVLLIINLISVLWLLHGFSWAILSRNSRTFLSLVLITSLLAELAGYRNLSLFVIGGLLATAICLGLTLFIYRLLKDILDGLDEGRLAWEVNLRNRIGLIPGKKVPGLIVIRIVVFIILWGGFAYLELNIWKLDDPWLAIITTYLVEGFQIGSLNVTPTLLAGGILAYAITLNLTRYIKAHVLPHGLKHTNLDRGAQEAVISLVGYAGVAAAILIALSITGVQMQNIAIIAGALSVGIGFGLQNIVNNFISGLILLFERPIRRGDWIITGDTEGYVKAINIRSTQIETFDRADVIVPNSELITAKVTNWMLRDPYGRVTLPIGVGYSSDVEKVRKILLEIANSHPLVLKDHPQISPPKVLFRSFGDNSLNFELRCFIRDIDQRMNVISEFNFAVVAAFRRENIEIPFPQRVVTVANWQNANATDTKIDEKDSGETNT